MTLRTAQNARHDSWRKQEFFAHVAEQAAARRRATAMRHTIMVGVAIGLLGSLAVLFSGL